MSCWACFRGSTLFDRVVAENGGVLYDPATRAIRTAGERTAASADFVNALKRRGRRSRSRSGA